MTAKANNDCNNERHKPAKKVIICELMFSVLFNDPFFHNLRLRFYNFAFSMAALALSYMSVFLSDTKITSCNALSNSGTASGFIFFP